MVLPEPDGPTMATSSPGVDPQRDAVERAHRRRRRVLLHHVVELEDGAASRRPSARPRGSRRRVMPAPPRVALGDVAVDLDPAVGELAELHGDEPWRRRPPTRSTA